jgi:predicted nucleic acid-binding protein
MGSFFHLRAERGITIVTSPITLSECLVHPLQRGLKELEAAFLGLIVGGEQTDFRVTGSIEGQEAARLRARYGLRLADAFQTAVAITSGCQAILTNDQTLEQVTELRILLLNDLEP